MLRKLCISFHNTPFQHALRKLWEVGGDNINDRNLVLLSGFASCKERCLLHGWKAWVGNVNFFQRDIILLWIKADYVLNLDESDWEHKKTKCRLLGMHNIVLWYRENHTKVFSIECLWFRPLSCICVPTTISTRSMATSSSSSSSTKAPSMSTSHGSPGMPTATVSPPGSYTPPPGPVPTTTTQLQQVSFYLCSLTSYNDVGLK